MTSMSLSEEDNSPFDTESRFVNLPINETESGNSLNKQSNQTSLPHDKTLNDNATLNLHTTKSRIQSYLDKYPHLHAEIFKTEKTYETHAGRSFVLYSIRLEDNLVVKRRYSEFQLLRNMLVKSLPTKIIPPVPKKQSLKSNLATSSIASVISGTYQSLPTHSAINDTTDSSNSGGTEMISLNFGSNSKNFIEQRRRLLEVFLNRCLENDEIRHCPIFVSFLDPNSSFHDYLNSIDGLQSCSIYRLSPRDPMASLHDDMYLTLPVPHNLLNININNAGNFEPTSLDVYENEDEREQMKLFLQYRAHFSQYEIILNNIIRLNRRILQASNENSLDSKELGIQFNSLSLLQDNVFLEHIGRVFDSNFFNLSVLTSILNLQFLDKMIELKNFIKVIKQLMDFNRNKFSQLKYITDKLESKRASLNSLLQQDKDHSTLEASVANFAATTNNEVDGSKMHLDQEAQPSDDPKTTHHGTSDSPTEADLAASINKSLRESRSWKIPGLKKLNKVLVSLTDHNIEETRHKEIHDCKLRIMQLEIQQRLIKDDNRYINIQVIKELESFHIWFKKEILQLINHFNRQIQDFLSKNYETWQEIAKTRETN
ncbi:Autophagy-related protein 20 [Komagataella phaffii CBS 7435]|uniref:Sorting nexin family member n=2 Tax=Komagataella phaffii TaxID=460519 RepID=C4R332_KOMPG|nr:Sorting nexin family member [Komagataella phaffii GS115]AOA61868.1 GQ67_01327T0 [Komagataella phaffii]CAH2447531.1 Autophagy-related protein 20 [Komagataella phaffii CBS 7435]AOA67740.1 GQ68_00063T0 [Komagataella phaffii GS115]CAY69906.1 Sorting nexin family member [Komagataella phaffii GS115]CCA37726.1 Autophagy-related protein 20 [Komagataella phaffii CBS 7435]